MALSRKWYCFLFIATLFLGACSNTRHLPAGDSLFLGGNVTIKDKQVKKSERKQLAGDLEKSIRPTPNKKVLGIRLKLTIYNLAGEPKKNKGLRYWLRNKVGEAPALTSQFNMATNKQIQTNMLQNRGFFYPQVSGTAKTRNRKTKAYFEVLTGPQYTIRNVEFVTDSTQVSQHIAEKKAKTLLKADAPYNLDLIKGERERIDKRLKNIGYYYFEPDYILVQVDTTVGEHKVDMFVRVKNDIPEEARKQYYINKVFIFPDFKLGRKQNNHNGGKTVLADTATKKTDTLFYERYYIVGNTKKYKPSVFTQAMQFQPGDLYSKKDHNTSLNRLVNMGTFKFVKNSFDPVDGNKLNTFYYLTSYPKKSIRAELSGLTKNDSRVGSQLSLSWRNRNTFRGAELLTIKATGGFETQVGGSVKRPNTYELGFEPSLTIPRFVVPFFKPTSSSVFVPHTTIRAGYDLLFRQRLYNVQSFKASYGYSWKEDIRKEHQLFPINITYVKTDTLNKDTMLSINYSNLVFNGLIIGPYYEFTYNSRGNRPPHHEDIYFDGLIDLSGNVLGLAQGANVNGPNPEAPKKIVGAAYAQYLKFQADFRYYINYNNNPNSIWANRILVGYGIPYGNSFQLPNIKQFFSGGNSSLRGFPSRLVGPGEFYYAQNPNSTYIETSGDIKLELNSELRAQLINFVHGAVFVDAGNIWSYRDNPLYPGGKFETDKFIKQLAVSAGLGLRLDFKILVLRLDLGMPLRKPWLAEDKRWVLDEINFGDPTWRKTNLVLNLGIGYPF